MSFSTVMDRSKQRVQLRCGCGTEYELPAQVWSSGYVRSCGCEPWRNAATERLYYKYQWEAQRDARVFDITLFEFIRITSQPCDYCKCKPSRELRRAGVRYVYNGIDRIDNAKGYIAGNMVACCYYCNLAKRERNADEFRAWLHGVAQRIYGSV